MVKLTATRRKALPTAQFAGANRSFPVDTKARAANAKARATQAVEAGRMSPATASHIKTKANRVLGKVPKVSHLGGPAGRKLAQDIFGRMPKVK